MLSYQYETQQYVFSISAELVCTKLFPKYTESYKDEHSVCGSGGGGAVSCQMPASVSCSPLGVHPKVPAV